MFKKGDFPGGWREIKNLRSVGQTFDKRIRVSYGILVLKAQDWGWPCDYCS